MSLPARGRGLKYDADRFTNGGMVSLPARGRGLKYNADIILGLSEVVAPRSGAWIEIFLYPRFPVRDMSLPARGRGLKSPITGSSYVSCKCRSPLGGVD